jgi:hypothetical protein
MIEAMEERKRRSEGKNENEPEWGKLRIESGRLVRPLNRPLLGVEAEWSSWP